MSECTGIEATWCSNCGDCNCPRDEAGERTMDWAHCPLHAPDSSHGEQSAPDPRDATVAKLRAEIDRLKDLIRALTHPNAVKGARVEIQIVPNDETCTANFVVTHPQGDEEALGKMLLTELARLFDAADIKSLVPAGEPTDTIAEGR
jgi:hypothetical protein